MAQKQKATTPPQIEALRRRIDHWRRTREKLSPMPEELWRQAVALAGRHWVGPVARGLRVDFGTLKIRLQQSLSEESEPGSTDVGGFVEMTLPPLLQAPEAPVTVELSAPDGAKLMVHLTGSAPSNLAPSNLGGGARPRPCAGSPALRRVSYQPGKALGEGPRTHVEFSVKAPAARSTPWNPDW